MPRDPSTPRLSWPLALLCVGLACVGLALVEAQRSIRSNRIVIDRALTGYANFAAWSYGEHLTEALRAAAQEVLGGVNMVHHSRPFPGAAGIGHGLPYDSACPCHHPEYGPMPAEFYGFTLGSDTLAVGRNQAPAGSPGWLVDEADISMHPPVPIMPDAVRKWIVDTMTRLARAPRPPTGMRFVIGHDHDSTLFFATTIMPTTWGDTIVYAVRYPDAALRGVLAKVLDDPGLLPGALQGSGRHRDLLAVKVADRDARELFSSGAPAQWRNDAVSVLPANYGGLSVRIQIQPPVSNDVIIGGVPRSRFPYLLALLALAAGLTVVAVTQLRREARFARDRSNFVANVSHELRTPLTQIRLVTDMLRLNRETDPARRSDGLGLIDRETTRLQHLVENVLRFTRGERPDESPLLPTDIAEEVRQVVAEFAPLAAPRQARIRVEGGGEPITVALRAGTLRQILLNLLDNAVKYGPDAQLVTVRVDRDDTGAARIAVIDAGPGIDARERSRIWQPFERGDAAQARAAGGSGIGLTIVRELAIRHGGDATVSDAPGGGAVFTVTLPTES